MLKHYKDIKLKNKNIPFNELTPWRTKLIKIIGSLKREFHLEVLQTSEAVYLRSSLLFLDVTRSRLVVGDRYISAKRIGPIVKGQALSLKSVMSFKSSKIIYRISGDDRRLYLITYLFTPWCRVLLEKLSGLQLVKKFPAYHGTRRFITALTRVRQLSLSCASPIQSIYPHLTSWRSILILSTHIRIGLPCGLFPSSFPTKTLYTPFSSPTRHMPSPSHSSRFYHPHNIGWGVQIT